MKSAFPTLATLLQFAGLQFAAWAASPLAVEATPTEDIHLQLIHKYLAAMELQNAGGHCGQAEVTIQARLPGVNQYAELHALRSTSPTGTVAYQALDSRGDAMVRREVIGRYLAATSQPAAEISITPAHYRFRFLRMVEQAGRRIHVFQLSPRQKRLGLFKGELWLDGQTALPVHESGRFVKSPSVFVRYIEFVRDYRIRDGVAAPEHIASTVATLAGRAELSVQYDNFAEDSPACP